MNEADNLSEEQHPLVKLSPPPSAYTENAWFLDLGGRAELRCIYEREGSMYAGGFTFERVRAYRHRAESHSTAWHVDAYDRLVEVKPSAWVDELYAAEPTKPSVKWTIRHFLIYVDSAGAYEVAAESWAQLPERPATLTLDVASGRDRLLQALEDLQGELASEEAWENTSTNRYLDRLAGLLGSIEDMYLPMGNGVPADLSVILADALRFSSLS